MEFELSFVDLLFLIGTPSIITVIVQLIINKSVIKREKKRKLLADKESAEDKTMKLLQKAMQALLRDRLIEHYKVYIKKKWIDIDDKNNFANIYDNYHSLGKNGVMDRMYTEIMELPTTPPPPKPRVRKETSK